VVVVVGTGVVVVVGTGVVVVVGTGVVVVGAGVVVVVADSAGLSVRSRSPSLDSAPSSAVSDAAIDSKATSVLSFQLITRPFAERKATI
jgi:hypothetical protein